MSGQTADRSPFGVPRDFWRTLAGATHRLLMLDYDGTLVPFHPRPEEARPGSHVLCLLQRIAAAPRTTVAVISGRRLSDLVEHLGPLPILMVAEHGWELRRPDGRVERHPLPVASAEALERLSQQADPPGWDGRVERKRTGIVLHTRGLPPEQAEAAIRAARVAWEPAAAGACLRLDRIDGGLEARAGLWDKGSAVRDLIAAAPAGVVPVYLGDDVTDEDALEAVRTAGYGIRVGADERDSRATGRLDSVEAVESFLERWLTLLGSTE